MSNIKRFREDDKDDREEKRRRILEAVLNRLQQQDFQLPRSTEKQVVNYIIGENPGEIQFNRILEEVLLHLAPQDIYNFCMTNRDIKKFCSRNAKLLKRINDYLIHERRLETLIKQLQSDLKWMSSFSLDSELEVFRLYLKTDSGVNLEFVPRGDFSFFNTNNLKHQKVLSNIIKPYSSSFQNYFSKNLIQDTKVFSDLIRYLFKQNLQPTYVITATSSSGKDETFTRSTVYSSTDSFLHEQKRFDEWKKKIEIMAGPPTSDSYVSTEQDE